MNEIIFRPIGIIHTPYQEQENTPIQGIFAPDVEGKVEVFPEYAEGLKDIQGFSHLILIYNFHKSQGCSLIARPFLDKEKKGIFSIRHFNRPNPIGLSIVRLIDISDNILTIKDVDILDGTPLLDIKPYVTDFDIKDKAKSGWYENASERSKYTVKRVKGRNQDSE